MHLRTEADVGEAWGTYTAQTTAHLEMCQKLNLNLIYVAGGNHEDVVQFTEEAKELGIAVISKLDFIYGEEDAPLDSEGFYSLSWDQKGVLDFEVLSRSSFFSGPAGVSKVVRN